MTTNDYDEVVFEVMFNEIESNGIRWSKGTWIEGEAAVPKMEFGKKPDWWNNLEALPNKLQRKEACEKL